MLWGSWAYLGVFLSPGSAADLRHSFWSTPFKCNTLPFEDSGNYRPRKVHTHMGLCFWMQKFPRFNQLEEKQGEEGSPVPRTSWASSSQRGRADCLCLLRARMLFASLLPQ